MTPPQGSLVLHRLILEKHEKSSSLKLEGTGLWYLACGFILWTFTKIVQIIASGSKMAPLSGRGEWVIS